MKFYGSFLCRCWVIREGSRDVRTVVKIEHIQTGALTQAAGFAQAERWMVEQCGRRRAAAPPEATDDAPRPE